MAHIFHILHFSICLRAARKLKVAKLMCAVENYLIDWQTFAEMLRTILPAELEIKRL